MFHFILFISYLLHYFTVMCHPDIVFVCGTVLCVHVILNTTKTFKSIINVTFSFRCY